MHRRWLGGLGGLESVGMSLEEPQLSPHQTQHDYYATYNTLRERERARIWLQVSVAYVIKWCIVLATNTCTLQY